MAVRVYVNHLRPWYEAFVVAFQDQLQQLAIAPAQLPVYDNDPPNLPPRSVILYFSDGTQPPTEPDLVSLRQHLQAGRTVLPVLDTTANATAKLPAELHPYNAFPLGTAEQNYTGLVDEVLSRIWLNRTLRKLFISYKRSDSLAIARQLHTALTQRGYDVFLDEASIDYGTHFQQELLWWLNDADFMLVLASPNLESSPWVMEEIEFANFANVGLLALRWPQSGPTAVLSTLMPDQIYELTGLVGTGVADTQTLVLDDVEAILHKIEEYRAQAIQRRLLALLPYLTTKLSAQGLTFQPAAGSLGDMVLPSTHPSGDSYIRVLPFRPTLDTLYDLGQELRALAAPPAQACLFYMENAPNDRRFLAFDWGLAPERAGETPSRYRLLPFTGETFDLGRLMP